jgi:multisubunit Na+/H+ antiporter MnhB subunit
LLFLYRLIVAVLFDWQIVSTSVSKLCALMSFVFLFLIQLVFFSDPGAGTVGEDAHENIHLL